MKIQFSACKLLKVDAVSIATSPMEGVGPRKVVNVESIAELTTALDAYKAEIAATRQAAAVSFWQVKERGARAFKGFKQFKEAATLARCLVNVDAATG